VRVLAVFHSSQNNQRHPGNTMIKLFPLFKKRPTEIKIHAILKKIQIPPPALRAVRQSIFIRGNYGQNFLPALITFIRIQIPLIPLRLATLLPAIPALHRIWNFILSINFHFFKKLPIFLMDRKIRPTIDALFLSSRLVHTNPYKQKRGDKTTPAKQSSSIICHSKKIKC